MIKVNKITKSYKDKKHTIPALQGISFQVKKGELFGLIGPDGAGKTTLFRILSTLLVADEGEAIINNREVVKDFKEIRKIIGYMPGKFSLYQDLSIEENLQFFADVFGTSIEDNYELIKDIYQQLEPFRKRKAGKLSGGMKQKLALCCSLIHKPQILFLDEPTTGVDPVSRKEFWKILKRLKQQEITIIVSTPYMDEANLCDRIALMQSGRILSIDTPKSIIDNFSKKIYAVKSNNNYELLNKLRTQKNIESCYLSGEYLHIIFKYENDRIIDQASVIIQEIKPGIEDVFMRLMKC